MNNVMIITRTIVLGIFGGLSLNYYNDYIFSRSSFRMREIKSKNNNDSMGSYYETSRAAAIINHNKENSNILQDREIGRVFAESIVTLLSF